MTALETRLAIQDVMTRYAAGVDDRNMEQYRSCFADDVEIVGFGPETLTGATIGLRMLKASWKRLVKLNICWGRNSSTLTVTRHLPALMYRPCIT
jgi:hypothetical protein